MKNYRNIIAFTLALVMAISGFTPLAKIVFAEDNTEEQLLEISDFRKDISVSVGSVREIEPNNEEEEDMINKFNEAAAGLDQELEMSEQRIAGAVGVGESILDYTTIPARVQLVIRLARAIRFATTELSNKVVAAHTKMTEYILVGILYVLNPFASTQDILDYVNQFEPLSQELLAYPDLQPTDIATIYKKSAVGRELKEARKIYRDANRTFKQFLAKQLKTEIDNTSKMMWRVTITCGELDEQVERLHEAMEKVTGPKIRVESINFMEGNIGYIAVDKRTRIRPIVLPADVKNKEVVLYSSNAYVARVSGGEIIPIKPGSVDIIAVAKDNGLKARFELIVVEAGAYLEGIPALKPTGGNISEHIDEGGVIPPVGYETKEVKSISFKSNKTKLGIGEQFDLQDETMVFPETAINKNVTFTSENEEIATVDERGLITAKATGIANILVEAENGVSNTYEIEVYDQDFKDEYEITEINHSPRKAGIFTIEVKATKNGERYTGPATITVTADGDRTLTKKVYLSYGKGEVKFNGFEFGVWRKNFTGKVEIKDVTRTFEINY